MIVLINPPSACVEDDHLEPQLGLLYIAALLQEKGFPVRVYEMTGCKSAAEIDKKIADIPEGVLYGITTYCTNYRYVKYCVQHIRMKYPQALIVLGGPNPTALPEFTLKDSECDCVVVGEGEEAFLYAASAILQRKKIPPIITGIPREKVDDYPRPAWDLVDIYGYHRSLEKERTLSLISSRGCPYGCIHCNSVVMGAGTRLRFRSPDNLAKEVEYLREKGFSRFRFNDDNFAGNPALPEVLSRLAPLDIGYRIFARIEDLTEDTCRRLKESGCRHISIGLESLNPDNLEFLRKSRQSGLEVKHLGYIKKHGMTVRVYFMIGMPYDNDKSIRYYFEQAAGLGFDEFSLYPLIPYPGTKIWKEPETFGYRITDRDFTKYIQIGKGGGSCFVLEHKNFSTEKVREWYDWIHELMASRDKKHIKDSVVAT